MAKEPGQTNFSMDGLNYDINPATGQYEQLPAHMTGFGSPYADPQYMSGTPAYGSINQTMPNISPYTGGVSASNPFPSNMTQYNYSGNAPFTFNEQWYLQQNPDVAAAVQSGMFPSGQAHYLQHGQAEGRQMNSNSPSADPNRIPYSTTNPYEVNPYLNFDVNRAYAVPAPIMNGTWNNLTLPTNIWKPTSYVNQVDQAREAAARGEDRYNPAPAWVDTSTASPFTSQTTQHGNTADWQRSDVDNTTPFSIGDAQNAITWNPQIANMPSRMRGKMSPNMLNSMVMNRGMGSPYTLTGGLLDNTDQFSYGGFGRPTRVGPPPNMQRMNDPRFRRPM